MFFDFSFYLLLAVILFVVVWLGWAVIQRLRPEWRRPILVDYCRELFPLLLIVFLLRSFVIEPFRIPSGSMLPNLYAGDLILVTKYDYGIRAPISNRVIIPVGKPQRGDILVFFHPDKTDVHYIKRVVGLPGDEIELGVDGVYVNGIPIAYQTGTDGQSDDELAEGLAEIAEQMRQLTTNSRFPLETRVEGEEDRMWATMHHVGSPTLKQSVRVPEDHYFVLGDNRDRSNDSRYWGFVPEYHIAGKARFIWLHLDWRFWHRTGAIDRL